MSRGCDGGYGAPYTWLSDHCTQGKILALDSIHTISSCFQKFEGGGIWKCAIHKNNENLSHEATVSSFDPTTLDLGGTSSGGRGALDGPGGRWMFNYRILQILKLAIILWNEILIL